MSALVVDTHVLIWYLGDLQRLSPTALAALDAARAAAAPIYVSAITLVEVTYLVEKGRLPGAALDRANEALQDQFRRLSVVSLDAAVARAMRQIPREAVPDMPDRIIAATALHLNVPLVTKDHLLQAADLRTIW